MSAYLCDPRHVGALASYICGVRPGHDYRGYVHRMVAREIPDDSPLGYSESQEAPKVALILARANLESIKARYPNDKEGERPGPSGVSDLDFVVLCSQAARRILDSSERAPVQVLKAVACLDYQSCEYDGWEDSTARKLLNVIQSAAIAELPGYDAAEWGWPEPSKLRAVK